MFTDSKIRLAENAGTETAVETEADAEREPPWQVIVLNDPVNLMTYVVLVFRRVLGFSQEKARKHMLEVHEQGRSMVWSGAREEAESYVHQLQEWQLKACLAQES